VPDALLGDFDVTLRSYLEVLAERNGAAAAAPVGTVVLHDSCVFARHEGVVEVPRMLLGRAGVTVLEPLNSRRRTWCRGGPAEFGCRPLDDASDVRLYGERSEAIPDRRFGRCVRSILELDFTAVDRGVVGREAALAEVEGFLDASAREFAALVLEGEAGIGKTTVWREGMRRAHGRATLVLACRPAAAEAKMSFAALADLLSEVDDAVVASLPAPQRDALQVALLRISPTSGAATGRAVAAGFLGLVRALAASHPVILAVDDWQWLDLPSRRVLEFAARRLDAERVGLLCSIRSPAAEPLTAGTIREDRLHRVTVGPLSLAALGRIISARLGRPLPRPQLVRISSSARGNPFYAVEIARMIGQRAGEEEVSAPLPVPDDLRKLTAARFKRLPEETREAVLLASVVSNPDSRSVDLGAIAAAEAAGIVAVDGAGRVHFAHPLFASAAYASVSAGRRRVLHQRAAGLVSDREQRARHLALASEQPDAGVAAQLDKAARLAASRGAPDAAAELAELAARLTPENQGTATGRRLLAAARFQFDAGDLARAEELAERVLKASPRVSLQAQSLRLLAHLQGRRNNYTKASETAAQALALAGSDKRLQAELELELAYSIAGAGNLPAAAEHAVAAAEHAEAAGDDASLAAALGCLTMMQFIGGGGLDEDRLAQALELADPVELPIVIRPRYLAGVLQLWLGDLDGSLERLGALYDEAVERGQEASVPMLLLYMVHARLWKGELGQAERLAEAARDAAALLDDPTALAVSLAAGALVHAHQGSSSTRAEASQALALFEQLQWRAGAIWPMWALGLLELSEGNAAAVDRVLGPLAELVLGLWGADPSFLLFLPDEVEALVALGEFDRAERSLGQFERSAHGLERDWAIALAYRCRALLDAARGQSESAVAQFGQALAVHERVDMPLERARTLLLAGQAHRRFKQRGRARDLLEEAVAEFERIGTPVWAEKARMELARIGRRGATRDELTETELRLARLAASGLSNREVAESAFVSVKTVEANLTRVYRKLGVRSRVGLNNALQGRYRASAERVGQSPDA
jgi:DNA-binding CsgD family transcriptional regulator